MWERKKKRITSANGTLSLTHSPMGAGECVCVWEREREREREEWIERDESIHPKQLEKSQVLLLRYFANTFFHNIIPFLFRLSSLPLSLSLDFLRKDSSQLFPCAIFTWLPQSMIVVVVVDDHPFLQSPAKFYHVERVPRPTDRPRVRQTGKKLFFNEKSPFKVKNFLRRRRLVRTLRRCFNRAGI